MVENKSSDWRELCAAAAREEDAEKLACLVNQIIEAFDQSLPSQNSKGFALSGPAE
jgi:hypothetical protein